MREDLARRIDAILPQTQCTRCGYPTCRAYADAIADGIADIDRCPPGGAAGVDALAALLGRASKPLDPACGAEAPPVVALIEEDTCIGCTKCILACPVDAIVGAGKRMHAVIAQECTGCELCLPPCPVDCIRLVPTQAVPLARDEVLDRAAIARARFERRNARLAQPPRARAVAATAPVANAPQVVAALPAAAAPAPITREAVLAAIARGRARRGAARDPT